jgi:hypothetical protein
LAVAANIHYILEQVVLRVIDFNCLQFTFQLARRHVLTHQQQKHARTQELAAEAPSRMRVSALQCVRHEWH